MTRNGDAVERRDGWVRLVFKGDKVWVKEKAPGTPLVADGKATIRYSLEPGHDYEYQVPASSLKPLSAWQPKGKRRAPAKKKPAGGAGRKAHGPSSAPDPSELPENAIVVYTDGAARGNPGPAGLGVVLWYKDRQKTISEYLGETTNNVAELSAIDRALSAIKKPNLPVRLYTDSKYAHGVLFAGWKAKKNVELVERIKRKAKRFPDLKAFWVRGHAETRGNELADALANRAIDEKDPGEKL
ncbi:MAG: ribonuclease HI [Deltaproteobacteria bacterium]|nr:ribonuclease HI [Deltaproteobacteria bacterium]